MGTFLLNINANATYSTDAPTLQILVDGVVVSSLIITASYIPFSFSVEYDGLFPSDLSFRFNDTSIEPGRAIAVTSVFINAQAVAPASISQTSLNQGDSTVITTSNIQEVFGEVDLTSSDLSAVTIAGTTAVDVLKGTTGDDSISGLDGDDTIKANTGNDEVAGGNGKDTIRGGDGNDILLGEGDNDYILGENGDDEIYGGEGSDNLQGGAGRDFISGGLGNDIIRGGDDADTLLGGAGNDVLRGEGGNDHIVGGAGLDLLEGGEGDDSLSGGDDNDTLRGGLGVDRLYGDAGNDRLFGDDGNDKLFGGEGNDLIEGGAGNDDIEGGTGNDRVRAGDGNDNIEGGDGNDNIQGGAGRDVINGGLGLDRIEGNDGDDIIHGNNDNDTVLGGAGVDLVYGDDGNDRVRGGDGNDEVYGGEGSDQVFGDAGDDIVYGGNGNDLVNGNEGNDTLFGEDGFDRIFGHEGNDTISGGAGNDQIYGNEGIDNISGDEGNDRIEAGDDADIVDGGEGLDTILGGAGDDVLNGGAGNDAIYATGTAWFDGGWEYRQTITLDSNQISGDLTDYTITIDGSGFGADFWDNVDTFGRDILFTSDDRVTELNREVYSIDTVAQTLEVHVKLPNISSSEDTDLYIYWGNSSAQLENSENTFSEAYGGVWHLGNEFNQFTQVFDSADGNFSAGRGGLDNADIITSQFGEGYQFNNSEYIALNKSYTSAGELPAVSVSAWVNTSFSGGAFDNWSILDFDRSEFFNVYVDGATGQLSFSTNVGNSIDDFSGGPAINDGQWHHVVTVYDGSDKILYVDGVEVARDVNTHNGAALGENITRFGFIGDGSEATGFDGARNGNQYDGQLDEVRLFEGALSADEIQAQFNNQNDPSSFYTLGDVRFNDDGVDSDILNGGDGDDTLYASSGNDILNGDAGNDTLYGSTGNDTLNGGDGNDIIYADASGSGDTTVNIVTPPPPSNGPIGEVGTITGVTQTSATQWHSITFAETLLNPVIKLTANTQNGEEFTLRVRNVTNNGFEWQIDEFSYQDGIHTTAEDLSWIAINAGTHVLDNGQVIQAGTVNLQNETQTEVSFNSNFTSGSPVVLSQILTDNDPNANVTRQRNVSTSSVRLQLQGEENLDNTIQQETVGWIAIDVGGNVSDGVVSNVTGNSVTANDTNVIFAGAFDTGAPAFFSDQQTIDGGDTAYTSGTNVTATGATVAIEEEQSRDAEVNHTTEVVGYLAIEEGVIENTGGSSGGSGSGSSGIDDTLYGGDGFDLLFGGSGRDSFVFESASAFNDVDQINFFSYNEQDALDISDLLTGYTDGVSDINDFVRIAEVGGNTIVSIDVNGAVGGQSYIDIVELNGVTGLTADALYANQSLIV